MGVVVTKGETRNCNCPPGHCQGTVTTSSGETCVHGRRQPASHVDFSDKKLKEEMQLHGECVTGYLPNGERLHNPFPDQVKVNYGGAKIVSPTDLEQAGWLTPV
jgi:hypothetical protein